MWSSVLYFCMNDCLFLCVQVMGTEKSTWREPFSDTSVYMDPGDLG